MSFPLVAFGLIKINKKNSYLYVVSGITLALYTHILSTLFLIAFTFIYFITSLFFSDDRNKIIENALKILGGCVITSLPVIVPILTVMTSNHIGTPSQPGNSFVNLVGDFDSLLKPIYFFSVFLICMSFYLTKKITIGQWISFVILIIGSGAICWPYFLQATPLHVIQFPYRLFNWGIFMGVVFSIFSIAENPIKSNKEKFLIMAVCFSVMTLSTNFNKLVFPTVNENGQLNVASEESIKTSYNRNDDGYHLNQLGAFSGNDTKLSEFWSLMNYADYAPQEIFDNPKSQFLLFDKKAQSIGKNLITVDDKQEVQIKNLKTNSNFVEFSPNEDINFGTLKLPVLGYNSTNILVTLNGEKINYRIIDGQIAINKHVSQKDKIKVIQKIPYWEIVPFLITVISISVLIGFYVMKKVNFKKREVR
ncbi:hypothetical protein G6R29_06165 [Fructobacillus sp. M2-14]|uniref:Uncharacterized protein n=1 Tax=Fructobacillus broussonetiae TaxID=2713173 RepID=A0ABS5R168_9LACO|nr:hypothetical protein [Fructobacillus broussonetiae]MBS9339189.1 hypothetical protein [Fructobacillus broussonetiae]